jgi:carboxyl-terminal processing protease
MKTFLNLCVYLIFLLNVSPANALEKVSEWKNQPKANFSEGEANFKLAMEKLLQEHINKNITKDDLYRAATAGMLEALNSGEKSWNTLLTPQDLSELQSDLSGQVSGIGVELSFDEPTGYARILKVYQNSPSLKAGIKRDDQVLSVNGKRFKGKSFKDLVTSIRGRVGEFVSLKILRDDQILSFKVKRETIPWTPVSLSKVDASTQLLTIGYFTNETPKLVEEKITAINNSSTKYLLVDLRDNSGGGFENSVQTAELFVPKDRPVVGTKGRDGKVQSITSKRGLLKKGIKVIILTNKSTSSGAELFAGALIDELKAKTVGEETFGKWNAQTIQTLSNGFAIKYSIMGFQTPGGHSYENTGLKPEFEVLMPKDVVSEELRVKYEMPKRLEFDPQLKAAVEFVKATQ